MRQITKKIISALQLTLLTATLQLLSACGGDPATNNAPASIEDDVTQEQNTESESEQEEPEQEEPEQEEPEQEEPEQSSNEVCPEHAILCEDFENGTILNPELWQIGDYWSIGQGRPLDEQSNHFVIDNTVAAQGSQSLHMRWAGEYGTESPGTFQNLAAIPAEGDEIYLRLYMRFKNLNFPGLHPYYISAVGSQDKNQPYGDQLAFGTIYQNMSTNAFSRGLDMGISWNEARNNLNSEEWFCLQIHVFGDHQDDNDTEHDNEFIEISINGEVIPTLSIYDGEWIVDEPEHWSPFYDGSFWRFGFASFASQTDADEYWIDSIAFSNQEIACIN